MPLFKSTAACLTACLLSLMAAGSPVHKILLNTYAMDEKGKKLQAIVAVYRYQGQPFEDPMNLGVETKRKAGKFFVKMPDMRGITDTCYAYIYFGGVENRELLPGYTFVVIGNNQRSFKPALLWVDRNQNLDLSDDGAPDTFASTATEMDLVLHNPSMRNAVYTVNLSRFSFSYNSRYIGMLDDYYKENSGGRQYAGTLYSFKEQRINTIAGDFKYGKDSFRIGIRDQNCNGIYNEAGSDFILIGNYKADVLPDNPIPIQEKNGKTWFERNGKRYTVTGIDKLGAYVSIREDSSARLAYALHSGKKLRKFRFQTTDRERRTVSIKSYKKKPAYIYVWRFGQTGFSEDTAILRIIARDYPDKIALLTLNYGETPGELKAFKRRNHINWSIGQSTQKINRLLFVEQFPYGVLTGKKLRIRMARISPAEILNLLKNNQI